MYGWTSQIDLIQVHDDLSCTTAGCSFVTVSVKGLLESYLELSRRASLATVDGLMTDNNWHHKALRRYLDQYIEMTLSVILARLHCAIHISPTFLLSSVLTAASASTAQTKSTDSPPTIQLKHSAQPEKIRAAMKYLATYLLAVLLAATVLARPPVSHRDRGE
jgi:hypothetical protein